MKSIYLVRHAKAGWHDPSMPDFKRPLTNRGHAEAEAMSAHLLSQEIVPEMLVSSPATRALETAEIFADTLGFDRSCIRENIGIYEGGLEELASIVRSLPDGYDAVMIFGHNPVISSFIDWLTGKPAESMETCGVAKIDLECRKWKETEEGAGTLDWYEYPEKK